MHACRLEGSDMESLKSGARSKTLKTARKEEGQGNILSDTNGKELVCGSHVFRL